jgi:hypothetical protein
MSKCDGAIMNVMRGACRQRKIGREKFSWPRQLSLFDFCLHIFM